MTAFFTRLFELTQKERLAYLNSVGVAPRKMSIPSVKGEVYRYRVKDPDTEVTKYVAEIVE